MSEATSGPLSADGFWRWDGAKWVAAGSPAGSTLPTWVPMGLRSPAGWRGLIAAVAVALLVDQALRVGGLGLGAALALTAAVAALLIAGRVQSPQSRTVLAMVVVFAGWLVLRASPWLTIPDLAACLLLLAVAASLSDRGSLFDLGFAEAGARILHGLGHLTLGVPFAVRPVGAVRPQLASMAPIARGLLIGLPVAILMVALLASADPVFASFFSFNVDPGQVVRDSFYVLAGGAAMCGLLRLAAARSVDRLEGPRRRLGLIEGLVVIAILDGVFGAFAAAQAIAATGSGAQALHQAGVTYADYARSGFFQLLWVAGITLVLLILFSRVIDRGNPRGALVFRLLTGIAILLTLLVVYVAFQRLSLYEEAYGFTMLRLYSHLFAVWIAFVFLFLAGDLLGLGGRRRWLVGVSGVAGLAVLLTLNVINPEALVVRLNTDRAVSTHKLDAGYLAELSSDAVPALTSSRTHLPTDLRTAVAGAACSGSHDYHPAWAAINLADAAAAEVRSQSC